jgi:two-component system sensor histidine kinase ChvG
MASATATVKTEGGRSGPRWRSSLTRRILAVNVLALGFLVGGVLFLGRYQERLIQAELEALEIEARLFAGALGEGAVAVGRDEEPRLAAEPARAMIRRLGELAVVRSRLVDQAGTPLADGRQRAGAAGAIRSRELPPPGGGGLGSSLGAFYDMVMAALPKGRDWPLRVESPEPAAEPAIRAALTGEGATGAWREADGSLLLTVTVPVQRLKRVLGALELARDGARIEAAVRSVRLEILEVFAVVLAVTVLLSLYLGGTIVRPLRRLARAADRVRAGRGRRPDIPDFAGRGDEIGELSVALREMTAALWARLDAIERFAADVAHEIRNPLTSLQSAVETVTRVGDPERRQALMAIIEDDLHRLDRLIGDISDASRLDAELSRAEPEPVDVGAMLRTLAELHAATCTEGPRLVAELPAGDALVVPGFEGRLVQVFRNLIGNALSFSPPDGTVTLAAGRRGRTVEISIRDQGPGLPEGKEEAIFQRFYSERPAGEKFGLHSGLGLSIARQIVEAHHGRLSAHTLTAPDGRATGACFVVVLPRE